MIPYNRQKIFKEDTKEVIKSLKNNLITTGPYTKKFEDQIKKKLKVKYASVCSSGTAAIDLAVKSIGSKKSDIFILPSWNEGLPNSMIEAMSSRLACIVTDVGSISDYIKHEENGLLIKPKSPGDLAKSIIKLIDNKILLNKISKNSFEFAMKNFTIKNAVEIFIREIESF